MTGYFQEVGGSAWAILQGLAVTLRYLFKPAVTIQYPLEKMVPHERFRGALLFDPEVCISCSLCVKACPSNCIALENATNPAGKKIARVNWYSIDFGKCNFCRLCEEACPTDPKSVWHSLDYELLFANRDEMVRLWKKEFKDPEGKVSLAGKFFDRKAKEYKDPGWQIAIHSTPVRRGKEGASKSGEPAGPAAAAT